MADNRIAIRCRACGESVGLAKRFGEAYYNATPVEQIDAFFANHFLCASNYPEREDLHWQDHFELAYETAPKGLPEIGTPYVLLQHCPRCAEDRRTGVKRVKVTEELLTILRAPLGHAPVLVIRVEEEPDGDLMFVVKRADPYVTRADVAMLRDTAESVLDEWPTAHERHAELLALAARLEAVLPREASV